MILNLTSDDGLTSGIQFDGIPEHYWDDYIILDQYAARVVVLARDLCNSLYYRSRFL